MKRAENTVHPMNIFMISLGCLSMVRSGLVGAMGQSQQVGLRGRLGRGVWCDLVHPKPATRLVEFLQVWSYLSPGIFDEK